jgi:twitching motility two-component system response regulator PilH
VKSILIVDDQEDERAIQRALLEHLGYAVREAVDGIDALDLIRDQPPDLVLLDIAMPRLDGLAVCRTLRKDSRTEKLPVLFLTASPAEEWEAEVRSFAASAVLIKPVDPHDVAREVEKLIGPAAK